MAGVESWRGTETRLAFCGQRPDGLQQPSAGSGAVGQSISRTEAHSAPVWAAPAHRVLGEGEVRTHVA